MAQALFEIVVERGPDSGRRFPLSKVETVIGREPTCDIPLQDEFASRKHAKIAVEREGHVLVNGSPIGCAVNGKPAERAVLQNGDQIDMGPYTRLRYLRIENKPAAAAESAAAPTRVYTGPPIPAGATTAVPRAAAPGAKPAEGAGRGRKMIVGFGIYLVILAGLFFLLSGLKGRSGIPEARELSLLQIEDDLKSVEVPLPANDEEANRWRQLALFLDRTSSYGPETQYRIYELIRGAARYEKQEPAGAAEQAMIRALRALVQELHTQYRRAYVADRAAQNQLAVAHYRRLRQMVPNHRLEVYKIAIERERLLATTRAR